MKVVKIKVIDNTRAPQDIKDLSTKKIGSVYTRTGDILRGLSLEEEKYYLPSVLGLASNDPAFGKATRLFWADMSIILDAEEGDLELSIGGQFINEKDTNGNEVQRFIPDNIMDWIRYRFVQKHPKVAYKREDIIGEDGSTTVNDKKYMYYLENKEDIQQKETELLGVKLDADKLFIQLFQKANGEYNKDKIEWIIDMYKSEVDDDNTDTKTFANKEAEDWINRVQLYLYAKKEKAPDRFLKILKDELLEEKAFLMRCISEGLLQKIGNTIVDDQLPIGESLKEAAIYIKNPKNSKFLLSLKERLKTFA